MTREAKIEAAARRLLAAVTAPDLGGAGYCGYLPGELDAIIDLRAALAAPTGPAPGGEGWLNVKDYGAPAAEIERAVDAYFDAVTERVHGGASSQPALDKLMAAIGRALSASRAEGWEAGRDAVVQVMNTRYTDAGRCAVVVMKLMDEARALPTPEAPTTTQDKE